MNVEQQIKFIKTELAKALDGFVGRPIDIEAVRRVVVDKLHHALPIDDVWIAKLANVLVLDWISIPEDADPKRDLAEVPTAVLDDFVGRLNGEVGGAASYVFLEWQRRHGHIVDWSFERISSTTATTWIQLKESVHFIQLGATVCPPSTGGRHEPDV